MFGKQELVMFDNRLTGLIVPTSTYRPNARRDELGINWPVSWRIETRSGDVCALDAVFDAQLMRTLVRYWEGAVVLSDVNTGARLGRGYLELTGYGDSERLPGR